MARLTTATSRAFLVLWCACLVGPLHGVPTPVHISPEPTGGNSTRTVAVHYSDEIETVYPKPVSALAKGAGDMAPDKEDVECRGLLYVTISPLISKDKPPRLAEITWDYSNCRTLPRMIIMYWRPWDEPAAGTTRWIEIFWSRLLPDLKGRIVTNHTVSRTAGPEFWQRHSNYRDKHPGAKVPAGYCMDFRVALLDRDDRIINTACIRMRPTWMGETKYGDHGLSNLLITEMMLPGTHNSLCYSRGPDFDSNSVRYLLTQDLTFWEQLVMGVRYFDIRVGYYPQDMGDQQNGDHPDHGQKFWVNHDMVRIQPLLPLLKDLRLFLKYCPGEIVVLDFHRFPVGFGSTDDMDDPHPLLIRAIKDELGPVMVPNDRRHQMASIKELGDLGKNVIVAYGDKTWQTRDSLSLWPPLPQQWGNQQSLEGLIEYLDRQVRLVYMKHYELWAMMAELTPTMFDVLLNLQRSSLRHMADQVNSNVTAKARRGYWNRHANIIAVDFIESSDLVDVAMKSNLDRAGVKRRAQPKTTPTPTTARVATTESLDSTVSESV